MQAEGYTDKNQRCHELPMRQRQLLRHISPTRRAENMCPRDTQSFQEGNNILNDVIQRVSGLGLVCPTMSAQDQVRPGPVTEARRSTDQSSPKIHSRRATATAARRRRRL